MAVADAILPHLPYLRRYARALTGSQKNGDSYVAATLEAVIADPNLINRDDLLEAGRIRVTLYRVLARIWNSLKVNHRHSAEEIAVSSLDPPARHLESMTPVARQAFLLCSVEGFTPRQAAEILDCDMSRLAELVELAGREIAAQVVTDVLIIEDEPLIAMDLADIVEKMGHRVVGRTRTHTEAIAAASRTNPGLVLADVQLADGSSGLQAVKQLVQSMEVAVIFITAYPERLLTGERPEPTFLITKPFAPDTVRAIVSQALFFGVLAGRDVMQPVAV
jgi:CheY-like chemotaxis protein